MICRIRVFQGDLWALGQSLQSYLYGCPSYMSYHPGEQIRAFPRNRGPEKRPPICKDSQIGFLIALNYDPMQALV